MKNTRQIKFIVVHCTATQPQVSVESIKRYWKEQKGWGDVPGYHYIVPPDGSLVKLWPETKNSYGVYAHNSECINIAYIGGIDKMGKPQDTRTEAQKQTLYKAIVELTSKYKGAQVLGHRDFPGVKKACPSFDVRAWLAAYKAK